MAVIVFVSVRIMLVRVAVIMCMTMLFGMRVFMSMIVPMRVMGVAMRIVFVLVSVRRMLAFMLVLMFVSHFLVLSF
jgi:hypothetical protein